MSDLKQNTQQGIDKSRTGKYSKSSAVRLLVGRQRRKENNVKNLRVSKVLITFF